MAGSSQGDAADWIISRWQRLVQITIVTQEEKLEGLPSICAALLDQ